jgi:DNA polymerase-3 subunit epsilon
VALVRVEDGEIVRREACLVRPPRRHFEFTYIHGISWRDVADQPTFADIWPRLTPLLENVEFLAAHNARFDQSVLRACCSVAGLPAPDLPFTCTMLLARHTWRIFPTKLPDVCKHLGLPLHHHNAASDAEACARIVLAAQLAKSV